MKKIYLFLILLAFLYVPFSYSDTIYSYLTKGYADTLYCKIGGSCNLTNITYSNVTYIDYNITSSIYINGTSIFDLFVSYDYFNAYLSNYYTKAEVYTKTESNALYCPISGGCGGSSPSTGGNQTLIYANECDDINCTTFIQVAENEN